MAARHARPSKNKPKKTPKKAPTRDKPTKATTKKKKNKNKTKTTSTTKKRAKQRAKPARRAKAVGRSAEALRMTAVGFVLLPTTSGPSADAVVTAHRALCGREGALAAEPAGDDDAPLSFTLGGRTVLATTVAAPIPAGEAEEAARASVSSLVSDDELGPHQGHVVVMMMPTHAPIAEELGVFARVLAAFAAASDAVGVYWGRATHPREFFLEACGAEVPVTIAVGVSVVKQGERLSILSLGLGDLGIEELMLDAPIKGADQALAFFFDLIIYALRRGAAVPAGETVGRDADERLPVASVPSPIEAGRRVWSVSL